MANKGREAMTFRNIAIVALAGLAGLLPFAAVTCAQEPASPANVSPADVQAGSYVVEPRHTRVLFSLSHMGFSTWYGDFTGASGSLQLDPHQPTEARIDLTVPVNSLSTTNAKLDDELKGGAMVRCSPLPDSKLPFARGYVHRSS